ncbi:Speckle-type POZ protein-like protein [Hordeum vulgare]|uniref:BTB/POZ and MATH domain-containing protein 1-like n=1 Tax=Hordeum vulgare subsp. vulgare TaxID=112509 RepID=UPI001D1A474F|nr:BTB/POZ and MATH domain-containing protein 1-like [Hordeum vulgare subsp. vulgare]KAE8790592.1 Speckle-type POZ protein-like protein [Hordeum vulgare]
MKTCKTVSMCTPLEEAQGTHVFEILDYSKYRGMGHDDDSYIRSGVFAVGDHNWAIRFFPDGYKGEGQDYISVYLELLCITDLRASCDMRLVDQRTGISHSMHKTGPRMFRSSDTTRFAPLTPIFIRRSEIEGSVYLTDDRLMIECVVTVFERPHVTETKSYPRIDMPPADMTDHVAKLLEERKGFDVSFIVGGETIEAHSFVLAMRSPVFKAELYGSMWEARPGQCITVKDMRPSVFKALLHFIYTDSLPGDEDTEMVRLLLVAADRYAMDRLKLVCQSILCEDLNKDTVATTLALADQYNCHQLKDACLQFMELSGFKDLKATCPSFIEDALEK